MSSACALLLCLCTALTSLSIVSSADYDVIGIDEGQFYPDLIEMVDEFLSKGKVVVVSALDGDFRRKPFGRVLELVPMAVCSLGEGRGGWISFQFHF